MRARGGLGSSREGMSPVDSVLLKGCGSKCSESSDMVGTCWKGKSK